MTVSVIEAEPGIVRVTLDDARTRNALDEAAFRDLAALWPQLDAGPCRAIVLTGAHNCFSSGANLAANLPALADIESLVSRAFLKEQGIGKPMIAAIDGACVAGGFELALACDVRLCSEQARLGLPEVRWGIFPSGGGARRLAAEIGYAPAAELLLSGRLIDAEEARRLGIVNRIVPRASLMEAAMSIARQIAANSPVATQAVKAYLSRAREVSADLARWEAQLTARVRASADAAIGAEAFLTKRTPCYPQPEG